MSNKDKSSSIMNHFRYAHLPIPLQKASKCVLVVISLSLAFMVFIMITGCTAFDIIRTHQLSTHQVK